MINPIAKLAEISKVLEDRFYYAESVVLPEKLKMLKSGKETIEALSKASGIVNESVLRELLELGVRSEIVTALSLIPIIEVAWADGALAGKEREAVVDAARKNGIEDAQSVLKEWLKNKPNPRLMSAWKAYMQGLCEVLSRESIAGLKADILRNAKVVAEASGSFLGLGDPVSPSELDAIDRIASLFMEFQSLQIMKNAYPSHNV